MVGVSVAGSSRSTRLPAESAVLMPAEHQRQLVAGRYQIEGVIAKGGMGAVYRAYDRTQNRWVALKRLLAEGDARHRTRMFEREFYALSGLKHPRIIEVYEYGIDEHGAYYTMELLGGRDLRELAPLPYRTACRYLRDVANSPRAAARAQPAASRHLAAQRAHHRRRPREADRLRHALELRPQHAGHGHARRAFRPRRCSGAVLDQRTDLYSLGALAYWMVTGRHAYHVRSLEQLPEAWRKPLLAPSLLVPKDAGFEPLPPELDALIMALLDHNPLARPVNAAEVVARLSAIAQLPSDDEPLSALSYLHGGKTVGRARQRAKLRKCVKAAIAGRARSRRVESEAGMGSGRLLADLAIEARLLGAIAIVVDAARADRRVRRGRSDRARAVRDRPRAGAGGDGRARLGARPLRARRGDAHERAAAVDKLDGTARPARGADARPDRVARVVRAARGGYAARARRFARCIARTTARPRCSPRSRTASSRGACCSRWRSTPTKRRAPRPRSRAWSKSAGVTLRLRGSRPRGSARAGARDLRHHRQRRTAGGVAARAHLGQPARLHRSAAAPDRAAGDPFHRRRVGAAAGAGARSPADRPRAGARCAPRASEPGRMQARARARRGRARRRRSSAASRSRGSSGSPSRRRRCPSWHNAA